MNKLKTLIFQAEHLILNQLPVISCERLPLQKGNNNNNNALYKIGFAQGNPREVTFCKSEALFQYDNIANKFEKLAMFPFSENEVQCARYSPRGNYRVVIRKTKDKTILEIWTSKNIVKSLKISDHHGAIYEDNTLVRYSLIWSEDEKHVLYIAEKNEPKKPKFWDDFKDDKELTKSFGNFSYRQDFGEGNTNKFSPGIFIYHLETNDLSEVKHLPENIVPGFVDFATKDGQGLIFMGLNLGTFKYGLRFCFNRDTSLYYIEKPFLKKLTEKKKDNGKDKDKEKDNKDTQTQESTENVIPNTNTSNDPGKKASPNEKNNDDLPPALPENLPRKLNTDFITVCPIISPDRRGILFFYSPEKHSHFMCLGLKFLYFDENQKPTEKIRTLVEPVQEPNNEFNGFFAYHDKFPKMNFLKDSKHFVFNSTFRNSTGIFIINIENGEIRRIDQPTLKSEDWKVVQVDEDKIIAEVHNIFGPGQLAMYTGFNLNGNNFDEVLKDTKWIFSKYKEMVNDPFGLSHMEKIKLAEYGEFHEEILTVGGIDSIFWTLKNYKNSNGESIADKDKPLMVLLHGGPHGAITGCYSIMRHLLLIRGYSIVCPNFTGSEGFGQKFIDDLLGKIGKTDVNEIEQVVQYIIQKGLCNEKKIVVFGGSYGGYLVALLIAKHPELYKSAILVNPVVSIPFCVENSDIPEWGLAEVFGTGMNVDLTLDQYRTLYEYSPISMNKDIKSSILLILGGSDRRVPPGGGLNYYKILKSKGVDLTLALYPDDNHNLIGNPEVEFDYLMKIMGHLEEKINCQN